MVEEIVEEMMEEKEIGVGDKADVVVYWLDCAGYMIEIVEAGKGDEHTNLIHVYHNVEIIDLKSDEDGDLTAIFKTSDGKIYEAYMGMWGCSLKRISPDNKVIFNARERVRPREW